MILVAGVTGNTGSVVAKTLLAKGEKVLALVRSEEKGAPWRERGAEVVVGALDDVEALTAALRRVDAAYLLTPPNYAVQENYLANRIAFNDELAAAVKASEVKRVVYLSSVAAHLPSGTGPILSVRDGERKLRATGTELIALRAAYFAENWGMGAEAAAKDGVLPTFMTPDAKVTMVSVVDIGRTAAELLLEGGPEVVELAGAGEYDAADAARAFSTALGREVAPSYAPLEAVEPTFRDQGLAGFAPLYREMFETMNAGQLDFEFPNRIRRGEIGLEQAVANMLASSK